MKTLDFTKRKKELVDYWQKTRVVKDKKILDAFLKVPREDFVLDGYKFHSYDDNPLPIGYDSTISQPSTVIMMLNWLEIENKDNFKILEVGTGSGYNAALIGEICNKGEVYSFEIIPELVNSARDIIKKLEIKNVHIFEENGYKGGSFEKRPWRKNEIYKNNGDEQEKVLFDRIIITAACNGIPQKLIDQLKEGGIILAPVDSMRGNYQEMIKGVKENGLLTMKKLGEFVFVRMKDG